MFILAMLFLATLQHISSARKAIDNQFDEDEESSARSLQGETASIFLLTANIGISWSQRASASAFSAVQAQYYGTSYLCLGVDMMPLRRQQLERNY